MPKRKVATFMIMNPSGYCYFNGDLVPYGKINLHVSDLLFQRGYGIFDYFRSRNGTIPWLEDYRERLFTSIELSGIEAELDRERFTSVIESLQEKNRLENGAFKVIITGGYSDNLESVTGTANTLILNIPFRPPPEKTYNEGVRLVLERFVRPNPGIKTLNYFNTLRLRRKLSEYDAVDVMYHTERISEASRANLFFVRGGQVYTPASEILQGITRKRVLSMFSGIREEDIGYGSLYGFDEMFLTSTSRDITPVVSVEGKKIGSGKPGPVTREIQAAFRASGW